MLNNVALDVVIGLLFIYLLYSLLATVLSEIIATTLGLRARNLKEALNRMLNDEGDIKKGRLFRFLDSLNIMKNPKNPVINNFYNHPEIKYLGSSGVFRNPSTFKAISFSKTILNVILENKPFTREEMDKKLRDTISFGLNNEPITNKRKTPATPPPQGNPEPPKPVLLDVDTAIYIRTLWQDSYGDVDKFKFQLEAWFERTMEQATEWYKRKIQIVLLILGFCMAWVFNADTTVIVSKLSTDKDAREKMVSLANAYIENNNVGSVPCTSGDCRDSTETKQKLDSLFAVKNVLDKNINDANTVLGLGGWLPDNIVVTKDSKTKEDVFPFDVEEDLLPENLNRIGNRIEFTFSNKVSYFFGLFGRHFWGYFITALAISLGAPFWFDLLNKLMKLRTSQKEESNTPATSAGGNVSPLKRDG